MVHVSKNTLSSKIEKEIDARFIRTIATLNQHDAELFFGNFFTHTERVLFAKRLAIIYLLREKAPRSTIASLLKVSRDTIYRLEEMHTHKEREDLVKTFEKIRPGSSIMAELKDLFLNGFSMSSKKRSEWLDNFEKRHG